MTRWTVAWQGSSVHGTLGKNTRVGYHFLLQGIFPAQESSPSIPHCRQILYQLSHWGSPRILEWVACSFSRGSSWPRSQPGVSCITGKFFTRWAPREASYIVNIPSIHEKKKSCCGYLTGDKGLQMLWFPIRQVTFLKKCIVALECCVRFCCTAKWISYNYTYIT